MDLKYILKNRHSTRDFSEKKVDPLLIKKIVSLAQTSPSWTDTQPIHVYCSSGKSLKNIKQAYLKRSQEGKHGNPDLKTFRRSEWDAKSQLNMKQWRHDIVHHFPTFDESHEALTAADNGLNNAPVVLYLTIPKKTPDWSVLDTGIFAQSLMLAATDEGVDSLITYHSVRFPDILRENLNIPNNERIIIGIELGYASKSRINSFRSQRENIDDILTYIN